MSSLNNFVCQLLLCAIWQAKRRFTNRLFHNGIATNAMCQHVDELHQPWNIFFPSPEHLLYQLDPPPTSSIHLSNWSSSEESITQTKIMMITLKITLKLTNIEDACNLLDPQLPGLTPEHVALVAATGLLMLFAFSYLTSESSRPIRQSRCLLLWYIWNSGDIIFTTFLHWKYSRFYQIDQFSRCW